MLTMKRLPYVLGVVIVLFAIIYAICHYSNNWYDDCVVSTITVKQGDTGLLLIMVLLTVNG